MWPYLFLGSNGYGRLEIDYETIVRTIFVDFRNFPKPAELFGILREYTENGLLFVYESETGAVWGEWDAKSGSLPRWKTAKDRKSPAPDQKAFDLWKKDYLLQTKPLPNISEIFGKFPLGVGVGVGVGVGKGVGKKLCAKSQKRFQQPTVAEVDEYGRSIHFEIDGEAFVNFYESKGWLVGRSAMKNWKAAVRTWRTNRQTIALPAAVPSLEPTTPPASAQNGRPRTETFTQRMDREMAELRDKGLIA
jgi:hypothetical protein